MNQNEQRCFDRLLKWEARCNALMRMYDETKSSARLPADRLEEARDVYRQLKEDLREEHRRLSNSRSAVTVAEDRWYRRVIHQGVAELQAPTNYRPEEWYADLYEVGADFSHAAFNMKTYFGV